MLAGPCVVEGEEITLRIAEHLVSVCAGLQVPLVFKASYRKANRSRGDSFAGIGDQEALEILYKVKTTFGVPLVTDFHSVNEAIISAQVADIIQVPAFLCRQTDILAAAAKTGKIVNVKKGQFLSGESMRFAVEKIQQCGNNEVMLTERGTMFGYNDLVVDYRNIPVMQSFGVPVLIDCTHLLQQPNQASGITGGNPQMIQTIARAGIAVGADGLFIETHPDPAKALSDGANMLPLMQLQPLLEKLVRLRDAVNSF